MAGDRAQTYHQLFEAIRYSQSCNANGDGSGERLALSHVGDLVAQLRAEGVQQGDVDVTPAPVSEVKVKRRMRTEQPPSDAGKRVRGHVPKGGHVKKFRLFEAVDGMWDVVAIGSAAELANEHGVTAAQVYALARKEGSTSSDGRYRCEEVIG